ncbi:MAG: IS1595 family transposase [Chloroflexi bacterium]|nr:IS1595 family transposase [Chloroflexota bacterium]
MEKFTLAQFNEMFPDEGTCLDLVVDILYPAGINCRMCEEITKHHRLTDRKAYSCRECRTQVYPLAGTIFAKSSTPLKSWFYAMYLMASTRTGISAKQLERELGVTYKTALRMFRQIRDLMNENTSQLFGEVEVDETYVGGKHSGKRGRGAEGKAVVMGMVERQGNARVFVTPDVKARTLIPIIQEHIPTAEGTVIYTDELHSYDRLGKLGYAHETVQHSAKQYVAGNAHVNNVEGLWSNVKRGIDGVNHAVSPKYLQGYLDSYVFRRNHRNDDQPMFETLSGRVNGKRYGQFGKYNPVQ